MNLTYTGRLDFRSVSSRDFPQFTFDFDEDVEDKEWVWVPGVTLEVPEEVGEFLKLHHKAEFKEYEEPEPDLTNVPEATMMAADHQPTPEDDRHTFESRSRDELIELAELKKLTFRAKATKSELVELLLDYYHGDEAINDEPVEPDSELDQP